MSKNNKPKQTGRVQVPAMYLHPDTVKTIDQIKNEMRVNRGIAVDEVVRRYRAALEQLERETVPA